MLRYEALSAADPDDVWALLARPGRWHEWAPHVRGKNTPPTLGDREVRRGAIGAARLRGVVPVPARVVDVVPRRSWSWRVGPVLMDHRVEPRPGGCLIGVDRHASAPVEAALRVSYGPVVAALVGRLARSAVPHGLNVPEVLPPIGLKYRRLRAMATTNLFAGIATADLPAARAFYERLFGRGPDLIPNDDEAAWRLTDDAWVYVVADVRRAGGAVLTLLVDDLDAQLADLRERGIDVPEPAPVGGGRSVRIDGPEGAMIQLAQVPQG